MGSGQFCVHNEDAVCGGRGEEEGENIHECMCENWADRRSQRSSSWVALPVEMESVTKRCQSHRG